VNYPTRVYLKTASNTTVEKMQKTIITEMETVQNFQIECYIKIIAATKAVVNGYFSKRSGPLGLGLRQLHILDMNFESRWKLEFMSGFSHRQ
jgi:hypothetical protein